MLEGVADYEALVKAVHDAEASGPAAQVRECYDALLAEFPLCFGYWKRFAEYEVAAEPQSEGVARANAVYERALTLGRYCVEIWAYYGTHAATHWANPEDARAVFERGAPLVGSDYAADLFWDRYLAFETARAGADHSRVAALYRRALELPLRSLDRLWVRFQQFSLERSCSELLDEASEAVLQAHLEAAGLVPPRPAASDTAEDDGARKLRVMPLLEAHFRRSQAGHAERLAWEGGVVRRYFHLRPLDAPQLGYWHAFLDWEEVRRRPRTLTRSPHPQPSPPALTPSPHPQPRQPPSCRP